MSEWPQATLADIAAPVGRPFSMGPFGSRIKKENYRASGVPVIRGGNLQGERFTDDGYVFLDDEKAEELSASAAGPSDVVFVAQGGIGQVGLVPQNSTFDHYILSQNLMKVTVDSEKASPGYVFYYFRSRLGQHEILSYANPTGVPCISRPLTSLKAFRLPLPPLDTQKRIAHILGTLDDKIELNRRMNRTLEAIARAIFKSWFVNFDPVIDNALAAGRSIPKQFAERAARRARLTHGKSHLPENIHRLFPDEFQDSELGPIPKGWEVTKIGAVCTIINGGTPSTKIPDYWEPEEIAWATPTDITALDSSIISTTARRISKAGLENSGAKLLPAGAVLVTSRATIGYSAISSVPIATNQGFKSIVCGDAVASLFMLQVVRELQPEIINLASGSTYPEINASTFRAIRFVLPHRDLVSAYQKLANGLFRRIELNDTNKHALAGIRGSLLPWLLSGELHASGREEPT